MKGDYKFIRLQNYFNDVSSDILELSFIEIESILGFKLCKSAYVHPTYWHPSPTHTITLAWQEIGFELSHVDIKGQVAKFSRRGGLRESNRGPKIDDEKKASYLINDVPELSNIDMDKILNSGLLFFNNLKSDANARYLSWEHCYKEFQKYRHQALTPEVIDYLSLQLAFYLASWGMYRGSSFLLQKDYKVHNETIIEIYKSEYKQLWSIDCIDYLEERSLKLLIKLSKEIEKIYIRHRQNIDGREVVSDVLITKILMGTFGCVPAYDRYFVSAIKKYRVASSIYNANSIKSLVNFYLMNFEQLENVRSMISKHGVEYPQMKIIDMCFWQIGFEDDVKVK